MGGLGPGQCSVMQCLEFLVFVRVDKYWMVWTMFSMEGKQLLDRQVGIERWGGERGARNREQRRRSIGAHGGQLQLCRGDRNRCWGSCPTGLAVSDFLYTLFPCASSELSGASYKWIALIFDPCPVVVADYWCVTAWVRLWTMAGVILPAGAGTTGKYRLCIHA